MTRDEIIARAKQGTQPVPFPDEAEPQFYLRPLKAAERREAAAWEKVHGADNGYQFLYVRSVCDEQGNRHFTDDDAPLVGSFPLGEVDVVVSRILKLNRMGEEAGKAPSPTTPS